MPKVTTSLARSLRYKCKKCRKPLEPHTKQCLYCKSVFDNPVPQAPPKNNNEVWPPYTERESKINSRIGSGCLVCLVIFCVITYISFTYFPQQLATFMLSLSGSEVSSQTSNPLATAQTPSSVSILPVKPHLTTRSPKAVNTQQIVHKRSQEKIASDTYSGNGQNATDQLTALVQQVFGDRLKTVEVTPQYNGGYGVFISFDYEPPDKSSIEEFMKKAYKAMYTSHLHVKQVNVVAYSNTYDDSGNQQNGPIYKTYMDSDIGYKINWSDSDNLDFHNLWSVDLEDPHLE